MTQCPICGNELQESRDMMDNTVMESLADCPACGYSSEFVTGAYRTFLPFITSYKNTPQNRAMHLAEQNAIKAIKAAMALSDEENDSNKECSNEEPWF